MSQLRQLGIKHHKPLARQLHNEKAASASTEAALELVPEAGIEPARPRGRGIFLPLRLSPPAHALFVVWSTPSP
ncbi:hypothetical protein CSB85_1439 [Pseudomonas aeruginosa]|nr:hypothetical protein CSB97_1381 [Pseudomonas aeruginosa]AVK24296.1 hypothetical protein CSB85_1439 [Pseudomonas aeruginosa]AWE78167.1 hypothetical protein CSC31_2400 [Pseudomonas aeruginosa]